MEPFGSILICLPVFYPPYLSEVCIEYAQYLWLCENGRICEVVIEGSDNSCFPLCRGSSRREIGIYHGSSGSDCHASHGWAYSTSIRIAINECSAEGIGT